MSSVTSPNDSAEVRRVDQEKINEFGKLNKRLMELRAELKQVPPAFRLVCLSHICSLPLTPRSLMTPQRR